MWAQDNIGRLRYRLLLRLWSNCSLLRIYWEWLPLWKLLSSCDVPIDLLWLLNRQYFQFDLGFVWEALWGVHFFIWRVGELYRTWLTSHVVKCIMTTLLGCGNYRSVLRCWRGLRRCWDVLCAHYVIGLTCENARFGCFHFRCFDTLIKGVEKIRLELFFIPQSQVGDRGLPRWNQCRSATFDCIVSCHVGITIVCLYLDRRWLTNASRKA